MKSFLQNLGCGALALVSMITLLEGIIIVARWANEVVLFMWGDFPITALTALVAIVATILFMMFSYLIGADISNRMHGG
jgi:hypothetical protein